MKFVAPIVSVIVLLAGAFSSELQGLIAAHPAIAAALAGLGSVLAAVAPQPHK